MIGVQTVFTPRNMRIKKTIFTVQTTKGGQPILTPVFISDKFDLTAILSLKYTMSRKTLHNVK